MMAGMVSASQVDWCLTSSTTALFSPVGRFSMPVMRFLMPRMTLPLSTDNLSQRAHIQYMVVLLTKNDAATTNSAQGITVRINHSMCSTERIKAMAGFPDEWRLMTKKPSSAYRTGAGRYHFYTQAGTDWVSRASKKSTNADKSRCTKVPGGRPSGGAAAL